MNNSAASSRNVKIPAMADELNAEDELGRSKQEREAHRRGATLRNQEVELTDKDDRQIIRGEHQESEHRKPRADG
jgi:hypothetical protein